MQPPPHHSAEALSDALPASDGESVYQAFTVAAILLVLASVWIF
ncbi:MAG TPA: hypothetical protein VN151_14110 [Terracidiphilus sp.]|nr:hypothetical protein [Terracidiphilus sp.]